MTNLVAPCEYAVKQALKSGADEAEAFASKIVRTDLTFQDKIEAGRSNTLVGIGVRTILGKKGGFYSVSSLERKEIQNAVERSLEIAKGSQTDPEWVSLPSKIGRTTVAGTFDKRIASVTPSALVEIARKVVAELQDMGGKVSITRAYIAANTSRHAIANSHGGKAERVATSAWTWLAVRAQDGTKKAVSNESVQTRAWRSLNFIQLAKEAADRASKMLQASPIQNKKLDVVWRNDAFAGIIQIMLGRTITADAVQKKRSPWAGRVGESIASENITVVDDGLRKAGLGSRSFDDDGIPQRRTPIVDKGVLRGFLYDSYTANKEKCPSTGNAHRDIGTFGQAPNYARTPTPAPNNLIVQPGDAKGEEVIHETKDGLYVVETIGEWLSNPIGGDMSATVTNGFLIENGELTKPVKGVIVSGNFFEILKGKIDLLGKDLQNSGNAYAPTARVLSMTVAGE